MPTTLVSSGNRVTVWQNQFFAEFIRKNKFAPYMGTNESSIIQVREDLTKKAGDRLNFTMFRKLSQDATRGATTLAGNEERLNNRSQLVTVDLVRNGVEIDVKTEQIKTEIDLMNVAEVALREWAMETFRMDIINALGSIDGVTFASSTAAQRNAWCANNVDRVLFGATVSNYNATHATALANIDATNDKLTPAAISLMKRRAKQASPAIRPVRVKNDEEWFVLFANTYAFRDLAENSTMQQANRDARTRGEDNPLFTGGDLIYDGVIIKEIEQIPVNADLGAGGTVDVGPVFLCGAQAIAVAYAQRTQAIEDTPSDYNRFRKPGIEDIRGVAKLYFGTSASADTTTPKDWGVFTGWFSAEPDA